MLSHDDIHLEIDNATVGILAALSFHNLLWIWCLLY